MLKEAKFASMIEVPMVPRDGLLFRSLSVLNLLDNSFSTLVVGITACSTGQSAMPGAGKPEKFATPVRSAG